ncbi:MAG: hypothetical protein IRY92_01990 [Dactylosporangium sp.]|nr:hypothetical protein [Dactylosporangium sp.]
MLVSDGAVVGVYLAFYSERTIAGRRERFCNLGAWCVLPEHRFHSLRLLRALLAQPGYTFTDLSPSGNVIPVNTRMKFDFLDTTTALVPALPRLAWFGRGRVSADPAVIEDTISGDDLERYRDHAGAAAARHLVLVRGNEWCYLVFRKDRRKRLPFFASILYASNPELLRAMGGRLSRHLLFRHGVLAILAELRVVRHRPRLSVMVRSPRRKMFKSDHLTADQIDYLYSELVCVTW